jgi:putative endonuclease
MPYHVYILQSLKDGSYYTGSTRNLEDRIERHHQGRSQYTKAKRPLKLVYSEEHPDRSSAVKRENQIKRRKSKDFIETLVRMIPSLVTGKVAPSPAPGSLRIYNYLILMFSSYSQSSRARLMNYK